jgi:hypothetical protein
MNPPSPSLAGQLEQLPRFFDPLTELYMDWRDGLITAAVYTRRREELAESEMEARRRQA